jgi:apolipoprotein D and lipocalin family protein
MPYFSKANKIALFIMLGLFVPLVFGCVSKRNASLPVTVVKQVNLDRYQGKWYEIARFPHHFQKDCVGSTAEYKIIDPQNISVENKCRIETYYGKEKSVFGVAHVVEGSNGAKLKVRFYKFPANLFAGDYWITMLDEDYNWVVVTDSMGAYIWVLSREQEMPYAQYKSIYQELASRGFKVGFLKKY